MSSWQSLQAARQLCTGAGLNADGWPDPDKGVLGPEAQAAADEAHEVILGVTAALLASGSGESPVCTICTVCCKRFVACQHRQHTRMPACSDLTQV